MSASVMDDILPLPLVEEEEDEEAGGSSSGGSSGGSSGRAQQRSLSVSQAALDAEQHARQRLLRPGAVKLDSVRVVRVLSRPLGPSASGAGTDEAR
jgi:hypothetical protein